MATVLPSSSLPIPRPATDPQTEPAPGPAGEPGANGRRRAAVHRLLVAAAVATYLLIVLGGVVRVTGSGLGCGDDWPRCNGRLLPPLETVAQLIEYSHRLAAAAASLLIIAAAGAAWRWRRERRVVGPASAAVALLVVQIALGAVVVRTELQPMLVMAHLGVAMLILGATAAAAVQAAPPPRAPMPVFEAPHYLKLLAATVVAAFLLLLSGAYTRATGAAIGCLGFPGCTVPEEAVAAAQAAGGPNLVAIQLAHRSIAYLTAVLAAAGVAETWRLRRGVPSLVGAAACVALAFAIQVTIGAVMVSTGLPMWLRGLHVAGAAAAWASIVVLWVQASRLPAPHPHQQGEPAAEPSRPGAEVGRGAKASRPPVPLRTRLRAYLALTKPKVIVLLEVPTLAAMLIAGPTWPSATLVIATLVGGALAAGGAAAINCYLDRDIDAVMGSRTQRRPIPAGLVSPGQALAFGLALAVASFAVLLVFANALAAFLAQIALLIYVLVYTRWLKRATPSNIVIGGAAGAIPPLVGWAAVTGDVGPAAWLLFAIIFFWTPPHFWALSLLIRQHYERARVPMLPVVRGDAETRRQILYYTVQMVCVTLLMFGLRYAGGFYLGAALVLGGIFLYLAARLWHEATTRAAARLFHYSMLYLWLLSAALVADKRLFG